MVVCNYCKRIFCLYRPETCCPSCGFSYCRKCCDNTIFVKQLKAEIKVCIKCSRYNSSGEVHMIPPPDCYSKKGKEPKCHENKSNPENINNESDNGIPSDFNESESDLSDDDLSDESSELSDGDELERENHNFAAYSKIYSHDNTRHVVQNTKPTNDILRDAIKQLREGFKDDKLEELRKKPPKCTLCSSEAGVNCKGCQSKFCMKCFDLHSDNVCAEYETLKAQVVN